MPAHAFVAGGDRCDLCKGHPTCNFSARALSKQVLCRGCGEYVVTATASMRLAALHSDHLRVLSLKARRSNKREVLFISAAPVGANRPVRDDMVARNSLA